MFKLEIGLVTLATLALGGFGYMLYQNHKAMPAAAAAPAPNPAPSSGVPTPALPGVSTTTTIDAAAARRDWDLGAIDGAAYTYNATVKGSPFDANPTLTAPIGVGNLSAYAAGHACGRAQGVIQGQRAVVMFGAAAAAALTFDPAPTPGGGVVTAACGLGFPAWLLKQGGSVTVAGRSPARPRQARRSSAAPFGAVPRSPAGSSPTRADRPTGLRRPLRLLDCPVCSMRR